MAKDPQDKAATQQPGATEEGYTGSPYGPGRRRTRLEIVRDRAKVAELKLKHNWTHEQIAVEMECSTGQVTYDLKALQRLWEDRSVVTLDKAKAEEIARIDLLEATYWEAWAESQKDREEYTETIDRHTLESHEEASVGDMDLEEDPPKTVLEVKGRETFKRIGQAGHAEFLKGVQWCIEKRCKIKGLDAPTETKTEENVRFVVGLDEGPGPSPDVKAMIEARAADKAAKAAKTGG